MTKLATLHKINMLLQNKYTQNNILYVHFRGKQALNVCVVAERYNYAVSIASIMRRKVTSDSPRLYVGSKVGYKGEKWIRFSQLLFLYIMWKNI